MSKRHGAREQKRLAKHKAKRTKRRRELARQESSDPTVRLKDADRWPIVSALVPENLWVDGIGNLLITRRMSDGRLACAAFLTDVFCLGVKDAMWRILGPREFDSLREKFEEHGRLKAVSPEHFAKLVHRAVEYAQSLGFPPHCDYRHAGRLLAGIDWSQYADEFQFGQDGRPHYIRGPSESMDKARAIATRIASLGGHYTIGLESDELFESGIDLRDAVDDDLEWEEVYEDDELDDSEFEDDEFEHDDATGHEFMHDEGDDDRRRHSDSGASAPSRRWPWLPWR